MSRKDLMKREPKLAEVSAHMISSTNLAGAFDAAFLFCMVLEVLGLLLLT